MLCKASSGGTTLQQNAQSGSTHETTWTYSYTFTSSYSKAYINSSFSFGTYSSRWTRDIKLNWTTVISGTGDYSYSFTPKAWDVISITIYVQSYNTGSSTTSYNWSYSIQASNSVWRELIPTEIIEIWEQWKATSYWRLPDKTRYWDFFEPIETTAITWNITLGNCVWFLPIVWPDWERYKIPIYWA